MIADDPFIDDHVLAKELPKGRWLTIYIMGDHSDAMGWYTTLIEYGKDKKLTFGGYALELTLIDHYISNDLNLNITQIQIPI